MSGEMVPVSSVLARQESSEAVETGAIEAARELGIPDALFIGMCEWLETHHVAATDNLGYRYAPNTRAYALQACQKLVTLRDLGVVGS